MFKADTTSRRLFTTRQSSACARTSTAAGKHDQNGVPALYAARTRAMLNIKRS